jgi:hypothetical protein
MIVCHAFMKINHITHISILNVRFECLISLYVSDTGSSPQDIYNMDETRLTKGAGVKNYDSCSTRKYA